ncbi:hypothetical protein ACFL1X_14605, partial [Candidatus Hydrogenedentota bacterium]
MMPSDSAQLAIAIIEELLRLLDEDHVWREIEEPIIKAAHSFQYEAEDAFSHQRFHRVIGDFIKHVYRCALSI